MDEIDTCIKTNKGILKVVVLWLSKLPNNAKNDITTDDMEFKLYMVIE